MLLGNEVDVSLNKVFLTDTSPNFLFADAFIEQQVWKAQVDLNIFQGIMDNCSDIEVNNKTRYVKVKQNSKAADSIESEGAESEEATGGEASNDETVAVQIFLETTV